MISKAKAACEGSGHAIENHFVDINKMVELGSGSQREISDIMLTRYAKARSWTGRMTREWEFALMADLIAAKGRKLEALQQHKKGLLQQFFPVPERQ